MRRLLSGPVPTSKGLNYSFSEFKNSKGDVLPADAFSGGFVRYVMTDELNKDGRGGCGYRPDHSIYDSLLVADPIDHLLTSMPMEAKSTRGHLDQFLRFPRLCHRESIVVRSR